LWVGTLGGLAKFNGKDFQSYSTENGILNNRVKLIKSIGDAIWVGHEGGVSKIQNNKISKWAFSQDFKTTSVSEIVVFKNRIIVASNGGGLFELKNDKLIQLKINGGSKVAFNSAEQEQMHLYQEDDLSIRDLLIFKGYLYIGTRAGVIKTEDLKTFRHIKTLDDYNVSGIEKQGDKLFITTFKDGLLEYSLSTEKLNIIQGIDSLLSLRGCLFDSKGNLWINTNGGVYRIKDGRINLQLNQNNGMPMESIRSIFEDKQGNIWMGSEGKGLLRFPGELFIYYNEETNLTSGLVLNMNQDAVGNYWIGTLDGGLMQMSKNKKITPIVLENNSTIWTSLLNVDALNWFGTSYGLIAMKGIKVQKTLYNEDGLPGDKITALIKISPSSFYIGGSIGVSLYSNGKITQVKNDDVTNVRDFCQIGEKIYCATDKGLYLIHFNRLELQQKFKKTIYSLEKDKENSLYIGTEEGLFCLKNNQVKQVNFSKTPSSNYINFLNYYNQQLYVGTNNGIFVLSDLDKKTISIDNYSIADGIVDLETNMNSSFVDRNGRLWFGTASGLVSFLPIKQSVVFSSPLLILKHILINYQRIEFSKYADGLDKLGLPINLKLPYSKNNLTFEMDGISLANYPGMQFQFWLEGQDNDWSPLNNNTTITFSGLSAGDYVLHARCADSKGIVSEEIKFEFTVKQAFYRTWWFFLIVFLTLAYVIFKIFKFRLKREREKNEKEKMEYKSRLLTLEQKSLNASMNRHFIFNSLNSIQYFINTQDRLSANRFLTNFAKLIRKNLDSSEDGNLVPLSQELERLELYMSLESMRFKDRFDYQINCNENIDAETVIIPAMMLQPFIENSIIHGILPDETKKGLIIVDITLRGEMLTIKIEDNGVGIETSLNSKTSYEDDHRSQGMDITTKRIELLKILSNKFFEINGPVQILNNDSSIKGTCVTLKFQVENLDY
jgi:ligand-binding sensor domain-containing protein